MKKLNKKLVRDLLSDKWQFIAVIMVVFLGVALFGSSFMAYQNLKSSYDYSYEKLNFADFSVQVASSPADVTNSLYQIPGVRKVAGRLKTDVGARLPNDKGYAIIATAISIPSDSQPGVNDLKVESGGYLSGENPHEMLVEKSFADYQGLRPGDTIQLAGVSGEIEFTIAGIAASPEYIFPAKNRNEFFVSLATWGVVFIPNDVIPEITGNADINEFCILTDAETNLNEVIAQSESKLAAYQVVDVVTKAEQPSNAGLKMDLDGFSEMAEVFPLLFLLVGAMTTFILLSRVIQRQRGQLGLMRALGYSRGQLLVHYLSYALVVGIIGTAAGIIAGYLLADTITSLYINMLGLPYKTTSIHWMAMEEGLFIGMIPCLIAGIFPALAASRLRPAAAMRTPPPAAGRESLLEKIFPFLKRLSLLWKIPLRNIFRNRRRSLATMLGVIFGTVLIMAAAGFIDSIDNLFVVQFDKIQVYDARISFARPVAENTVKEVTSWNGITAAAPVFENMAEIKYGDQSFSTLVVGLPPKTKLYGLISANGNPLDLEEGSILIAGGVQKTLGISTGDMVSVVSATGTKEFKVGGLVEQPMGSYGYITLNDAQSLGGGGAVITGILLDANTTTIDGLRAKVSQELGVAAVEITDEIRSQMNELIGLVNVIAGVMMAFGIILALMVVFTMISISLTERRREIATMRTLGQPRGRIAGMVTIENLALGITGLIIGLPLGYLVSMYIMGLTETDMFSFNLVIYTRTYLVTVGTIMLVMLISQLPGILGINRLDLAKVTKEQVS